MTTDIRTARNEVWLESLTIELRLLDVNGTRIGDAVATAREFLVDSGAPAEDSFGSPKRYAAELNLPAASDAPKAVRGATLRGAIGVLGLFGLMESLLPLAHGESVTLGFGELVSYGAVLLAIALLPGLIPVIVRMRRCGLIIGVLTAAVLGGTLPLLLSLWSAGRSVLSLPALPVFIIAAVLLIAPALWSQLRQSLRDDPIVVPGAAVSARPTLGTRIFLFATNWMLVFGGLVLCAFVLWADPVTR